MPPTASPVFASAQRDEPDLMVAPRLARWLGRFNLLVLTAVLLLGILLGEVW